MKNIKEILLQRDNLSEKEADDLIREARDQMDRYLQRGDIDSAYHICEEYFGLEPDYITQLM
ncbi:hypothetical protein LQ318_07195 [Aliifodinibius salicampi]|uniref:Uncharacterized protein n=1 Tax=Fodinibius salicampi TaxID=1920655 RepID=A0ABT3PXY6_9BACT|nr:hypothetical protein [Fodinibius salicampi]MCW9712686.1 hypothetical protein [Fodinibius salicampi]